MEKTDVKKQNSMHLVLDEKAQEIFNSAFKLCGATTKKEAINTILARFVELNDLKNYHNQADIAELERVKSELNENLSSDLTKKLTDLNVDLNDFNANLTKKNTDLNRVNTDLNAELIELKERFKNDLNAAKEKATHYYLELEKHQKSIEQSFGALDFMLLKWSKKRLENRIKKELNLYDFFYLMFKGFLKGDYTVVETPSATIVGVLKNRLKEEK
ncbi:MAG: hypothetical protein RR393_07915 [Bacteroidales bacterium]